MNDKPDFARTDSDSPKVDPDPFAIGFALLGILFSGGAYLELRRQRQLTYQQMAGEFRGAWFKARRTLIHARRVTEEFATYVQEDGYGDKEFLFGKIRLFLEPDRVRQLRRLHANAQTTASYLADALDGLGEFLDASYQPLVDDIMEKLTEQQMSHSYDAVVLMARDGVRLYERLIQSIGEKEGFSP